MKPKLIIFDLNKTLIQENSWLELNKAMGVSTEEDDMLMKWGQEGTISDAEGQAILCNIYKKRGDSSRSSIEKVLSRYTYLPGAQESVAALLQAGHHLALISGSMDILVEKVAGELGIKAWACNNRFIFDENNFLKSIETVDNDSTYKATQAQKIADELNIPMNQVVCVGDGANDAELFQICGISITFKDSPLESTATYAVSNLKEIVEIIQN